MVKSTLLLNNPRTIPEQNKKYLPTFVQFLAKLYKGQVLEHYILKKNDIQRLYIPHDFNAHVNSQRRNKITQSI